MRKIDLIVVHCTATPAGRNVTAAEIRTYHKTRGFADIGYHFIIRLDGTIEPGRPIESAGAHAKGFNANSIGVAYVGGLDSSMCPADTRTRAQRLALLTLLVSLKQKFPDARIIGHRDVAPKACPCFDATLEYAAI